jgi:SsrA-binding protein
MKKKKTKSSGVASNRRAGFDISVEKNFDAGIVLTGDEIKSVRADRVQLTGAYVRLLYGKHGNKRLPQVALIGMHLALAGEPQRTRLLLLNAKEVRELESDLAVKGKTAVPQSLYFSRGWLKVKIGVGTGRKGYDKKNLLKERDIDREARASLKEGGYRG